MRIARLIPSVRRRERLLRAEGERLAREHRQRTGSKHALHVDVMRGVVTDLPNPDNDPRVAPVVMPKFKEPPPVGQ